MNDHVAHAHSLQQEGGFVLRNCREPQEKELVLWWWDRE